MPCITRPPLHGALRPPAHHLCTLFTSHRTQTPAKTGALPTQCAPLTQHSSGVCSDLHVTIWSAAHPATEMAGALTGLAAGALAGVAAGALAAGVLGALHITLTLMPAMRMHHWGVQPACVCPHQATTLRWAAPSWQPAAGLPGSPKLSSFSSGLSTLHCWWLGVGRGLARTGAGPHTAVGVCVKCIQACLQGPLPRSRAVAAQNLEE